MDESAGILEFLRAQPLVCLFLLLAVAMRLGRIRVAGISLGTSAVVFVALGFGALGLGIPGGLGTLGLVLFTYAVGLDAGPGFFRAFVSRGRALARLSLVVVGLGASIAAACGWLFELDPAVTAGLFAGALTSTPGLAAATEAVARTGGDPSRVTVAFGLAYPFGVVAVVGFVQILRRRLPPSPSPAPTTAGIERVAVKVENPAVLGRRVSELPGLDNLSCQVTRQLLEGRWAPLAADHRLLHGDVLLLVAERKDLDLAVTVFGERVQAEVPLDTEHERAQVVVTHPALIGRTLEELDLPGKHHVVLSRIVRYDLSFVPRGDVRLRPGDQVYAVGSPKDIEAFMRVAGHRARALYETDLASLALALLLGILVGQTPLLLPGGERFALGLAGGPLLAGLLLGHFGRLGGLVGYVPRAARMLLSELGLGLFLAEAGIRAGAGFDREMLASGLPALGAGALVTSSALFGGWLLARRWMGLGALSALGGLCGGMTSTPGIGALAADDGAEDAVTSYAAAYPVALILMSLASQAVLHIL